jgi:hypothetical protein
MTKERKDKIIHIVFLITTLVVVFIASSLFVGKNACVPRIQKKENNVYIYQARVYDTQMNELRSFNSYEEALRHCTGAYFEFYLHYDPYNQRKIWGGGF